MPAKGRGYYESIVHLQKRDGEIVHAQATSHNEMRRLLSALNAHCIKAEPDEDFDRAWPKTVILAGWLWQEISEATSKSKDLELKNVRIATVDGVHWRHCWAVLESGGRCSSVTLSFHRTAAGSAHSSLFVSFTPHITLTLTPHACTPACLLAFEKG